MLGYVRCCHIPDDVKIGHCVEEQELKGIERGNYSHEYDKDLQNLAPDHYEKTTVVLMVVLSGNRASEVISGTKFAKFSHGTTVWVDRSLRGTKRTGQLAKRAERNPQEGRYCMLHNIWQGYF